MPSSNALFDTDDLSPIFKFLGKNWYLILLFPILFYTIAYIYSYRMPNVYAAKTEILLKSSETYDYQNSMNSSFGYFSTVQDVINQKRVLTSYNIIENTLDKLNFEISYYLDGGVRKDEVLGFKYVYVNINPHEVPDRLKNKSYTFEIIDYDSYNFIYNSSGEEIKIKCQFDTKYQNPFPFELNKTTHFKDDNIDEIKKHQYKIHLYKKQSLISKYSRNLSVLNEDYTSILTLKLEDNIDIRAKIFLDTLSKVYINYSVENQIRINENTRSYIEKQLFELKEILDSLEFELHRYRESKNIINLSREQNELFNQLSDLKNQKQMIELRESSLRSVFDYTTEDLNDTSLPPIINSREDVVLNQQVNTLYKLKLKRTELLSFFTKENYSIKKQDTLIQVVTSGVRDYLISTHQIIKNNSEEITAKINHTLERLKKIPKSEQGIIGIKRKLQVNENLHQFLLEKKASTVIARAAIIPQVSIIESARSLGTIGPDRNRIRFGAAGIGIIFALVIGVIRLLFFERIETLIDFKEISSLPVIGGIPFYKNIDKTPLTIQDNNRSIVSESFRTLRANLQYTLDKNSKVKKILISSLHPSEGKTFVSTNMATFLASSNKKTVLIDFDLHKPKVHKILNIKNKRGLSSFLIGKLQLPEIINTGVIENLDVISAGPIPPNASDLILNGKVNTLIALLEESYDYIIFDTPPLMLISDSLVLLKEVDTGIFVFNSEKATKEGVRFLEDVLKQNKLRNIAYVLNGIKQKKWTYYKSKYSNRYAYKYGYGSGYGYSESKGGYGSDYIEEN